MRELNVALVALLKNISLSKLNPIGLSFLIFNRVI
jgi:hypothetical protein